MKTTSETLREAIQIAGLTQKETADYYGIPLRTLEAWLGGTRTPPNYVTILLLRCLAMDFPIKQESEQESEPVKSPTYKIYPDYGNKPFTPELSELLLAEFLAGRVQVIGEIEHSHEDDAEEPVPATHKYGKLYLCTEPDFEKGIPMGCLFRVVTKEE